MNVDGELVIYKSKEGEIDIKIRLADDDIWLSQEEIALLFNIQRPAVTRHINNIYKSGELNERGTCSILERMGSKKDSQKRKYKTKYYNLDAIISVGYRVNSKKATEFRIWATKTLREYLTKGYSINSKRLESQTKSLLEVKNILQLISRKSKLPELIGHEKELFDVVAEYAKSWKVLGEFDEGKIKIDSLKKTKFKLNFYICQEIISSLKDELVEKRLVGELFALDNNDKLPSIISNLYQTYDGNELYNSIEEKAAHLLYFVIKDHPFIDGNKRVASLLFLYYLEKNNYLFRSNGSLKINNSTIIALALLVASSNPKEKGSMIKLIINLIQD